MALTLDLTVLLFYLPSGPEGRSGSQARVGLLCFATGLKFVHALPHPAATASDLPGGEVKSKVSGIRR